MKIRRALSVSIVLAVGLCVPALRSDQAAVEPRSALSAAFEPVTVEAVGMAPFGPGVSEADAYREALLDARRNALIQAHVTMQVDSTVHDMRLDRELVRAHTAGYIRKLRVWEAGRVGTDEGSVYRVRVRAIVFSLPTRACLTFPGGGADGRWQPAVRLTRGKGLPQGGGELREALVESLRRCGVLVVSERSERPALLVRIWTKGGTGPGAQATRVGWDVTLGEPDFESREGQAQISGHWFIVRPSEPDALLWERLGVAIAQDAMRLWCWPRDTVVEFHGVGPDDARVLADAFGRLPGAHIQRLEDARLLRAIMPLAGDPLPAVESVLSRTGLRKVAVLKTSSLTHLTYVLSAGSEGAAAG